MKGVQQGRQWASARRPYKSRLEARGHEAGLRQLETSVYSIGPLRSSEGAFVFFEAACRRHGHVVHSTEAMAA
jgi:hypothetical protein